MLLMKALHYIIYLAVWEFLYECVVDEPVDGVEVPGVSLHQLALEAHVPIKVMSDRGAAVTDRWYVGEKK